MTRTPNRTQWRSGWNDAVRGLAAFGLFVWCALSGLWVAFTTPEARPNCAQATSLLCEPGGFELVALWLPGVGGLIATVVGIYGAVSLRAHRWPLWFVGLALSFVPSVVQVAVTKG